MEITRATTPGGRFTYAQAGAADAPAIVFLHGIGGGAALFARQLSGLAPRHRAIAWNMPGYGGSAAIAPDGIDGYAHAFAAFLGGLGLAAPVLVGHSIGGMILQAYLAHGGAARGIVLAQTSPAFGGRDPRWAEDFVAARLAPLDSGETLASLADAMVTGMVGDDPDAEGVDIARTVIAATPEPAYRASTLAMIGFDRRAALERIAVPTLLVAGTRDTNAPAATMARMAERIPDARFVAFEGCGHLVMLERPGAFTDEIAAFADSLPA